MATTTLTHNHQKIIVPANTDEHEINFDGVLKSILGHAYIKRVSGTSVQLNSNGVAITASAGDLSSDNDKIFLPIKRGTNIKMKGGAGGEVFIIIIWEGKGQDY